MDEWTPNLKSKAKLSYEKRRLKLAFSWLRYPLLIVLVSYGISGWTSGSQYLSIAIFILCFIGVWYGLDFSQGVQHGLTIGSLGLWMPVLAKLMNSLSHLYHGFLCVILGMVMSMGLWNYLIRSERVCVMSLRYLLACCTTSAATASLCCPSIGMGSVGGIILGVLSVSTSHYFGKFLNRNF
ncbi:MAG: hypothetical protein AB8G05_27975 [Oligoflexales bacterium]